MLSPVSIPSRQVPIKEVLEHNKDMVMGIYSGCDCNLVCLLYTHSDEKRPLDLLSNCIICDSPRQSFGTMRGFGNP